MKIQTGHGTITLTALLAIYSISMVTSLPGLAISPILGDLKNIFKDASDLELQMLESLPSFIIVPFILLAGRLSLRINKKRILIIGLSIFFGCSVIYPFSNSLWLLLLVSALLGVVAGMVIPFSTELIADNFTKRYRTRQLGIASAITNISLVFATFLAGVLASINWRYAFLVYCLSGISLLFAFKLNSTPPAVPQSDKHSNDTPVTTNHNWPIALMFLYYFITFIVLTVPFNLSIYMETLKFKDPDISGTFISIFFLAMTIPGLFINNIIGWLRGYTNVYSAAAIALGFVLFIVKGGPILLTIGVLLIGIGYGCMQPIIYDKTSTSTTESHATFALALVMAMNYIAIITYPFILEILQEIFSTDASYFPFLLSTILACIFAVFTYLKRNTNTLGMQIQR